MQNNVINNSYNEICVSGGGNFLTQSTPTYFHQFFIRKVLTPNERIDDFMEVTPAQRDALEAVDATFVEPPHSFIDQWNAACGSYGRYNAETGYFNLNGLTDITYEQALAIFSKWSNSNYIREQYWMANIRTNIPQPLRDNIQAESAFYGSKIEVCNLSYTNPGFIRGNIASIFRSCSNLERVIGVIWYTKADTLFYTGSKLKEITVINTGFDMWLESPVLSFDSLDYLVAHRNNQGSSNTITVTVHEDVYAKLTGDTTNAAAAALTPDELGQWMALVETATEKNITFATA